MTTVRTRERTRKAAAARAARQDADEPLSPLAAWARDANEAGTYDDLLSIVFPELEARLPEMGPEATGRAGR